MIAARYRSYGINRIRQNVRNRRQKGGDAVQMLDCVIFQNEPLP